MMSAKPFILNYKKTKYSYRKVPINSLCERYLKQQIKLKEIVSCKRPKQQNDFLFVTKFNTPLNSVIYSDAIKAVIRNINLQRAFDNQFEIFSGHTFRHTFATRCFENGIESKVVQDYLGHASLKMTMDLYTHVPNEKSARDIEKSFPTKWLECLNLKWFRVFFTTPIFNGLLHHLLHQFYFYYTNFTPFFSENT